MDRSVTAPAPAGAHARAKAPLRDQVAVVTGASRGGGRAIALVLGEAGATVYVTGRSTRAVGTTENLPGTIDETAEAVTARGGTGIPVRVDHTADAEEGALRPRASRAGTPGPAG